MIDVPHFAARFGFGFAVKVQRSVWGLGQIWKTVKVMPDQVFHPHIAVALSVPQRPTGDGANMLFELANGTAVLCPVP